MSLSLTAPAICHTHLRVAGFVFAEVISTNIKVVLCPTLTDKLEQSTFPP